MHARRCMLPGISEFCFIQRTVYNGGFSFSAYVAISMLLDINYTHGEPGS